MLKSENLSLTFFKKSPSPPPSPRWGEGKGEGKFQIFLARNMQGAGNSKQKI
jgi:hypothetical protein